MKIFILGGYSCKYPSFSWQCKMAFDSLGHKTKCFNYRYLQLHRTQCSNKILHKTIYKKIIKFGPEILLVTKGESILPNFINKIGNRGIKTANWVLDDPTGKFYPKNKVNNISEYDAFFVFDPAYVVELRKQNPNTHYLPCAADPDNIHKELIPLKNRKYKYDVSFVGSHEPYRQEFFKKLTKYDLHIWGFRWGNVKDKSLQKHIHKEIPRGKHMCEIFNNSKININIHAKHSIDGLNLRTFEVPATKSFLLTDYYSELSKLFKVGKEAVFYKNIDDLKKKIDYYLKKDKEREKIALAGYNRVIKEHTMKHRIIELLKIVKRLD